MLFFRASLTWMFGLAIRVEVALRKFSSQQENISKQIPSPASASLDEKTYSSRHEIGGVPPAGTCSANLPAPVADEAVARSAPDIQPAARTAAQAARSGSDRGRPSNCRNSSCETSKGRLILREQQRRLEERARMFAAGAITRRQQGWVEWGMNVRNSKRVTNSSAKGLQIAQSQISPPTNAPSGGRCRVQRCSHQFSKCFGGADGGCRCERMSK